MIPDGSTMPLPDCFGHMGSHDESRREIEKSRPNNGLAGGQNPGGNDRGDGIGRVMESVQEIETQGYDNDENDERNIRVQSKPRRSVKNIKDNY